MGIEVGLERADVAPVARVPRGRSWYLIEHEVVGLRGAVLDQVGDDVAADVVPARVVVGVLAQRVDQDVGVEHVVAHGRVAHVRVARHRRRVGGLFQERVDGPAVRRDADDAEIGGFGQRHRYRRHRDPGPVLDVVIDHLHRVHPVHVVRAEDDHDVRLLVVDQVHRLEDGVRRAGVPVRAEPLLRRHRCDVVAEQGTHPPRGGDVTVQAMALVLGQDADLADAAVGHVGQREIDQPVEPAERHRRLGPVRGQRAQPGARSAGEHDSQDRRIRHDPSCAISG